MERSSSSRDSALRSEWQEDRRRHAIEGQGSAGDGRGLRDRAGDGGAVRPGGGEGDVRRRGGRGGPPARWAEGAVDGGELPVGGNREEAWQRLGLLHAMGRVGEADEVARAVLFLA